MPRLGIPIGARWCRRAWDGVRGYNVRIVRGVVDAKNAGKSAWNGLDVALAGYFVFEHGKRRRVWKNESSRHVAVTF